MLTIANTEANPLLDEFILNFDYLYEKGAINDYQKEYIAKYETEIHTLNKLLIEQSKIIEDLTIKINNKKAEEAGYEKSITSAKEELVYYETLRDNEVTNTPIVKDGSNSCPVIFVTSGETTEAKIKLEGVACGTISGYSDCKYEKKLFGAENLVIMREKRPIAAGDTNIYVLVDEYGYADVLYTAKANLEQGDSISEGPNSGFIVYLTLEYSRYNKYVDICNRFENLINKETQKKEEQFWLFKKKQAILDEAVIKQTELLDKKQQLNQKLEKSFRPRFKRRLLDSRQL